MRDLQILIKIWFLRQKYGMYEIPLKNGSTQELKHDVTTLRYVILHSIQYSKL